MTEEIMTDEQKATIKKIATLEAKGEAADDLRQELFTNGVDYPDIDSAVAAAGKVKGSGRKKNWP